MRRRSRAGGEPAKSRRGKQAALKQRNAPKSGVRRIPPVRQETEVARLTRERDEAVEHLSEALKQQTAASEVLRLISGSPSELGAVFDAILVNATRLCEAKFGILLLWEGDAFRTVALHNAPPAFVKVIRPAPVTSLGRLIATKQVDHVADMRAEKGYVDRHPGPVSIVELAGARTVVNVPMLKERELIGCIALYRQEVRPFTDKQIALLENFAAQAVIAIENTRLLNELRESLEQQTATADVLRVISSSPGDLEPVFQAMLANATRICDARFASMFLRDGDAFRSVAATQDAPRAYVEARTKSELPLQPSPEGPLGHVAITKEVAQTADLRELRSYQVERHPFMVAAVELGGFRTALSVPMLKDNELVGAINILRQEVRPFTEKQIELVKNFAAQAVIAIENTRLLNELRESLDRQTATADVLRIISSSPGDLKPVFATILDKALHLCEAAFGFVTTYDGERFERAAQRGVPDALAAYFGTGMDQPRPGDAHWRLVAGENLIHSDQKDEDAYRLRNPLRRAVVDLGGARSALVVALRKDKLLLGALTVYRKEVRPFTQKQIELVQNFAAQAVIAIENARLLNELRQRTVDLTESLEQQTATSEVFELISSPQASVQAILDSVAANAVRLCEALHATIYLRDGEFVVIHAHSGPLGRSPIGTRQVPNNKWPTGRAVLEGRTIHVPDLQSDDDYPQGKEIALRLGHRTTLAVPLIRNETAIGAILLRRREVRPFNDRQIALVQNFAAQAVIAIENARLLKELRERTEEVVKLNQQLEQRVADQVGEIERMGRLRRFLPPQVADLIVASGTEKQLESHRREITALFCDLRGFTGFSESSDPEDVMALLSEYHAAIGMIINKYSGTLERYAGDGVMVIFNDPVPVENPALQAVLMALDMRAAIGELIEKWRDLGHDLGFGIGIAHGFATLGTIGFEGRRDYAAIGTVSNVASRLCDEAKPGQILISPRVRQSVEKAVTVETVGEFALKGIRRPMVAYNVLESLQSKRN
jgi:GAF domain-containing protein